MNVGGVSGAGAQYPPISATLPRFTESGASCIIVGGKTLNMRGEKLPVNKINEKLAELGYELQGEIIKTAHGWSASVTKSLPGSTDPNVNIPHLH